MDFFNFSFLEKCIFDFLKILVCFCTRKKLNFKTIVLVRYFLLSTPVNTSQAGAVVRCPTMPTGVCHRIPTIPVGATCIAGSTQRHKKGAGTDACCPTQACKGGDPRHSAVITRMAHDIEAFPQARRYPHLKHGDTSESASLHRRPVFYDRLSLCCI